MKDRIGTLKWKKQTHLSWDDVRVLWNSLGLPGKPQFQSAWYDHSYTLIPYTGQFDGGRIEAAIQKKLQPGKANAVYGKFGGWSSCGQVYQVSDTECMVEFLYHIGD